VLLHLGLQSGSGQAGGAGHVAGDARRGSLGHCGRLPAGLGANSRHPGVSSRRHIPAGPRRRRVETAGCREFLFIFAGLAYTGAARMVVFIYLAPCLAALGLHWFVPSERLRPLQWAGVLCAFGGITLAFGDGFAASRSSLLGDAFGVIAAVLWAATTVVIRATSLSYASASKTLFYQLAVAAVTLPVASVLMGEPGVVAITPVVVASIFYQGVVVAFATYLIWFWLLTRYYAARLSVFSFLTPLFGVIAGVVVLSEPITPAFIGAVAMVGAGIYLVNVR